MSVVTSPEMFINMRHIPSEDSAEYEDFFAKEAEKIEYGVTINGVYIHGWLYWHINHWKTYVDYEDRNGNVKSLLTTPQARDNEWMIADYLKKAEDEKKGLMFFGTRRFGKSEFESSYVGRSATIFEGSQNILSGGSSEDIAVVAGKLDKGLDNIHPALRFDKIHHNWTKYVSLGTEEKKRGGRRFIWSEIFIRNFDEGRNTEVLAGLTPKALIIDEAGKSNFLEALTAAQPALSSRFGWRAVPIVVGTGGSFKPNSDAEKLFRNPESLNFLSVLLPNREKPMGIFIDGTKRLEGKVETTFGEWYKNEKGIILPKNHELYEMKFFETDEEKAKAKTSEEIKSKEDSNMLKEALKIKMYYPENPEDCFLSEDINEFPVEAIRQHLSYLDTQKDFGKPVTLYRDVTGQVNFSYESTLRVVTDWPVTPQTNKNAPVVMYEPPMDNPPYLLYIAGSDPYNTSKSITTESLGTLYIYKRIYDLVSGTFQQSIVASYASRPPEMKEWCNTVEMLLELYSATCLTENVGTNFIEYLKNKHKDYLLADGYSLLKQISPKSAVQQPKGLPPTIPVINHCMNLLYEYCREEIEEEINGVMIKRLGVTRIPDKMLLLEMLNYHKEGNYDRIVAFRHALAYDSHLVRIAPSVRFRAKEEEKPKLPKITSPFNLNVGGFRSKGTSPFRI